ncbi:hypothetical protein ABN214_14910 [Proteus terrae]|uniref:hypothetical protein n=1 Tax=Proteus terrae TaxID=1574161 RepID=UPI0032DB0849
MTNGLTMFMGLEVITAILLMVLSSSALIIMLLKKMNDDYKHQQALERINTKVTKLVDNLIEKLKESSDSCACADKMDYQNYMVKHIEKYLKRNVTNYIIRYSYGQKSILQLIPKVSIKAKSTSGDILISAGVSGRKPAIVTTFNLPASAHCSRYFNETILAQKEISNV